MQKNKREEKRASDQRNKIICIFCHASHPVEHCKMWCAWRKTNSMSQYKAVFVSAAFIGIAWTNVSLENECAAKKVFSMIYFFYGGLQEYFVLSSGSLPACCRDMSGAKISLAHKPAVLFPAAIFSTLGGHFTFSYALFPLPLLQTLQHGDYERWFLSQFDGPCFVFLCLN